MGNHQNSTYRFERKFFVYNLDRVHAESIILSHPSFFSEIFHERFINNIYFDFPDFNNLTDNIIGNTYRKKYRIRWYGNMIQRIENPTLEIKIKKGLVGLKEHHPIESFELTNGICLSEISDQVQKSSLDNRVKYSLNEQIPVLLNRYRRKYFETRDKKFRVTIDDNQSYFKLNLFNNMFLQKHFDINNIIIELKYDHKFDSEASRITNFLPFRMSKSSKYAKGIELFYA